MIARSYCDETLPNSRRQTVYITKLHFKARQQMSKLKLSDHSLEIERGRYHRPCMFCHQKIENEFHFLTECTAYSDERQNLVNSLTRSFPNIVSSHKNKLFSIICECNEQHSKLISSSVQKFNEIRNEKIELISSSVQKFNKIKNEKIDLSKRKRYHTSLAF